MEYQLTFLRHGSSEGVEQNLLQGHLDYPLSNKGWEECQSLARYWQTNGITFDRVITSSLVRASETGRTLAEALGIPIESDAIWIERCFGDAQGIDKDVAGGWYEKSKRPGSFEPIYGNGESEWALHMRAGKALENLMQREPGRYLIVSHGNFLNAIFHMIFGLIPHGINRPITMPLRNTGYASFRYVIKEEQWYMDGFNQAPHLDV